MVEELRDQFRVTAAGWWLVVAILLVIALGQVYAAIPKNVPTAHAQDSYRTWEADLWAGQIKEIPVSPDKTCYIYYEGSAGAAISCVKN